MQSRVRACPTTSHTTTALAAYTLHLTSMAEIFPRFLLCYF